MWLHRDRMKTECVTAGILTDEVTLTILALNQGDQGWQDIINNLKEKVEKT